MLHVSAVPHSAMSRQVKSVMFLSAMDKQHNEVIYCPACKAPVVNSAYGIRRHLMSVRPQESINPFRHYEDNQCETAFRKLGYNSNGEKTTSRPAEA